MAPFRCAGRPTGEEVVHSRWGLGPFRGLDAAVAARASLRADELLERGHRPGAVARQLQLMAHGSRWLAARDLSRSCGSGAGEADDGSQLLQPRAAVPRRPCTADRRAGGALDVAAINGYGLRESRRLSVSSTQKSPLPCGRCCASRTWSGRSIAAWRSRFLRSRPASLVKAVDTASIARLLEGAPEAPGDPGRRRPGAFRIPSRSASYGRQNDRRSPREPRSRIP